MKKVNFKPLILFFISFIIAFSFYAQVIPTKKNNLWGAVTINGIIKIPLKYKSIDFYSDKYLLAIHNKNKKGLFSIDGTPILNAEFDAIIPIKNNYFQVFNNGKTGIVKTGNKTIIPILYESIIYDVLNNYFIVSKNNKYGILDSDNIKIISLLYDNITVYNNRFYLFKKDNLFAIADNLENTNNLHYFNDLTVAFNNVALVKKENLWGLENLNGKTLLSTKYEIIKPFYKKFLLVKKDKKFGIFNTNGIQITPFAYNNPFYSLDNNRIWTKKENVWTSINLTNSKEQLLPFEKLLDTTKNFFRVLKNNRVVLINKNEELLFLNNEFQDIIPINDSIFKVLKNRKWGIFTKKKSTLLPIIYDKIELLKPIQKDVILDLRYDIKTDTLQTKNKSLYFLVEKKAKKGIFNFSGKEIIAAVYDNIQLQNNTFITTLNLKKGAIDSNGIEILKPIYSKIQSSKFNLDFVYLKNNSTKIKFLNKKPILLDMDVSFVAWSSKKEHFFASKKNLKGLINSNNQIIIPFKHKRLYDLDENFYIGITNLGARLFNKEGTLISTDYYSNIKVLYLKNKVLFSVSKNLKNGVIDANGHTVIPFDNYNLKFTEHALFRAEKNNGKLLGYFDFFGRKFF